MRHTRVAGQALRLAAEPSRQPYVCRACYAHASRQFSTSSPAFAESDQQPFWKRMQNSLFGSKESKQAEQSREEKTRRRIEDAGKRETGELETKTDRHGRLYEVAEVVDPTINDRYLPATTWDGLESVGSEQWVKARADNGEQYFGFISKKQRKLSSEQWEKLLHHVVVEALTLQKAGRDLGQICNSRQGDRSEGQRWIRTANATISSTGNQIFVQFADAAEQNQVLEAIAENGIEESAEDGLSVNEDAIQDELLGATNAGLILQYANSSKVWMQMSLRDPNLKLAIIKRITQLTGRRISDLAISNANTVAALYHSLQAKEQSKKLARTDEAKRAARLPNVTVHATRRTPVHKEKEIGRWKIIEDELTLRNLPVFGSRYVDAKEGKLLQRDSR